VSIGFKTVSEAADELGVSSRRIRQLIEAGDLPGERLGSAWVVPAVAVDKRKSLSPRPGRPFEQSNLWKLAALADEIGHEYANDLTDDSSWKHALHKKRNEAAGQLQGTLAELSKFDSSGLVKQPAKLTDLRNLLSYGQSLVSQDELSIDSMLETANHMRRFESKARVDSKTLSEEWLNAWGGLQSPDARKSLVRKRFRLVKRLADGEQALSSLRGRFDRLLSFHARSSVVWELQHDSRLAISGDHAAAQLGLGLVPGDFLDAYVRSELAREVVKDYSLQDVPPGNGNVVLRVVNGLPENHPAVVPRLFVGADLLEDGDPRRQKVGSKLIAALCSASLLRRLLSRWK
jgi:excisionase family DNA binding protein